MAFAQTNNPNQTQLFSVSVDGDAAAHITNFDEVGRVLEFQITPDSTSVVVLAANGLFVAAIDGSGVTRLDTDADIVDTFVISSDSQYVVYHTFGNGGLSFGNIFSVEISGQNRTLLSDITFTAVENPSQAQITPDGKNVLFTIADASGGSAGPRLHLYSTPIEGGPLTDMLPVDAPQDIAAWQLGPNSEFVYYLDIFSDVQFLRSAIADGAQDELSAEYDIDDFFIRFTVSQDGDNVLYTVVPFVDTVSDQLFFASSDGADQRVVSNNLLTVKRICDAAFSPDNSSILFCEQDNGINDGTYYSASVNNPQGRNILNGGATIPVSESNREFSFDSQRVFISATDSSNGSFSRDTIISFPLDGGAGRLVSENNTDGSSCFGSLELSQQNNTIAYCEVTAGDRTVFIDNAQAPNRRPIFNTDIAANSFGEYFRLASDGSRLIYILSVDDLDNPQIFTQEINELQEDDEPFCFPIKAAANFAVVCL